MNNIQTKSGLLAGVAAFVIGTGAASAQEEAQEAARKQLDTITVTAQFREESLQDAGLAIDALSGDDISENGIAGASDLSSLVPALTITNGGGVNGQLFVRGVGNRGSNNAIDPAVVVNYDGVALARGSASSIGAFFDVERVEVLKGPQGTLYGKNATGGVLNLVPKKPKIGVEEGFVNGGIGSYSDYSLSGAVNRPIGENAAFRIGAQFNQRDGYMNDGSNDKDAVNFRGQYLIEPSDTFSLRIAADYSDIGGIGSGTTPIGSFSKTGLGEYEFTRNDLDLNEGARTDASQEFRRTVLSAPGFGFLTDIQDEPYTDASLWGINSEIIAEFDAGVLTVIPAYREVEQDSIFSGPGFNSGWWQNAAQQRSLEMRFAGEQIGAFDYILGGIYFDEDVQGNNTFNQEFVLPMQDYDLKNTSWAIFGEATWHMSDATRLTAGLRYTEDKKEIDGEINNFITFCGGPGPNLITPPGSFAQGCAVPGNLPRYPTLDTPEQAYEFLAENGFTGTPISAGPNFLLPLDNGVGTILHSIAREEATLENQEPTYRLLLEQDLFEDSLLFASFSHGYRAGGLTPSGGSYDPEFIDAYTIGMKNTFNDGRVQINAEAFWWEYEDQQITYFTLKESGVLTNTTENVGKSSNKGIEVDVKWLATDNTLIDATVQYLDASYDDSHFITAPPRDNINCPFTRGVSGTGGLSLDFDCSGNQSIFSPTWTVKLGIEQTFPLSNGMNFVAALDTTYVDDQVTGFTNLAHEIIESHTKTNANLTLRSSEGDWYVAAYAKNLEDEHRVLSSQSPLSSAGYVNVSPDLTYGVRFGKNF